MTTSPIQMHQILANPSQSQSGPQAPIRQSTGNSLLAKLNAASPVQSPVPVSAAQNQIFSEDEKRDWGFKFHGYPAFARWMGTSEDFFLLRRFSDLNARVLLSMQDEIMFLEERLQAIDKRHMDALFDKTTQGKLRQSILDRTVPVDRTAQEQMKQSRNDTLRHDPDPERKQILKKLRTLLKEYNESVIAFSDMRSRTTANERQITNLENWLYHNYPGAIDPEEHKFAKHHEDLIPILTKDRSPLRHLVEKSRKMRSWSLFSVNKEGGTSTSHFYSGRKMDAFTNVIIIVLGLAMLFGPTWWLNSIESADGKLGIITGFTFLFTVVLVCSSVEQPFQILAGTAAYAAVLMVFMQTTSAKS
ncbi:hypothetical protein H2200_009723 [Cladophialophora chaetospira]|uniref:DUF6594 domain-containing protein n=1 Tax=Cladophialophora chaetospira TaxID=386627 RepID=A0AA38X319_9EURO|nr:hypothetical protein H2200_009723 [Cladophialophora chaetospira]